MAMFAPNGLLSSSLDKPAVPAPATVPSFTLNGLLGPASSSASGSSAGSSKQFAANGLLSAPTATVSPGCELPQTVPTFTPNGLLSGPQEPDDDYDPPTVAQAFGIPTPSTSEYVPRFSVKATTFDGKTINLKRKLKISHANRNPHFETLRNGWETFWTFQFIGCWRDCPPTRLPSSKKPTGSPQRPILKYQWRILCG
ncbi:hypothetical protein C8R47DRAFT_420111 [Mycena vitilis]|nr:hypothetical protein C8R47DRAFT_420111 [Mycena vitilis]